MVLCKFYQQGYCRYGGNCRFEHSSGYKQTRNDYGKDYYSRPQQQQQQVPRYETQNRFSSLDDYNRNNDHSLPRKSNYSQNTATETRMAFEEFVSTVISEIGVTADSIRVWPLSCFGPQKESDEYPGLEDISPEELRWEFIQSQLQGRFNEYVERVTQMIKSRENTLNEIRNRSPIALDYLRKIYKGQKINSELIQSGSIQSPFGSSLDASAQNNTGFRFSQKVYDGLDDSNRVGSFNQSLSSTQNVSNMPQNTHQQNAFGFSGFGSNTSGFTTANNASSGFSAANIIPSGFSAANNTASGFSAASNTTSGFFTSPPSGFTNNPSTGFANETTSAFQAVTEQPSNIPSQSLGVSSNNSSFKQVASNNTSKELYTLLEELTDVDRDRFIAQHFVYGSVPLKPPPSEYC